MKKTKSSKKIVQKITMSMTEGHQFGSIVHWGHPLLQSCPHPHPSPCMGTLSGGPTVHQPTHARLRDSPESWVGESPASLKVKVYGSDVKSTRK